MTSGRVLLPEENERTALPALEAEVAAREGWLPVETPVGSLEELAGFAGARAVRDGDWVLLATDKAGEPKWSEQASAFYAALSPWVREGEVRLTGEDGTRWSYRYSPDGVAQSGVNGWDGSSAPVALVKPAATSPVEQTAPEPPAPEPPIAAPAPEVAPGGAQQAEAYRPPPDSTDPFWSMDAPPAAPRSTGRTVGMVLLLVGGLFCIIMLAMLAAGMAG